MKNCNEKIIVRCQAKGCEWVMRAYEMCPGSKILVVRSFNDVHKHDAQEDLNINHSTRSKLTSLIIVDCLRGNIEKAPSKIRRDLYREYGVRLNYSQAYWGKRRALLNLEGSPKDSYKLIPWLCDRLKETDQDTVAKWKATGGRFERLFIAYGCSIKGFLAGCRPVLIIDGCFLTGPYRGTLLSASAHDTDNDLFPVAYAIVSGETEDNWEWFMENVKEITRNVEITIISDRNPGIITAVRNVFGSERHAYCYRHVKENFSKEFGRLIRGKSRVKAQQKEDALRLLDAIAYARLDEDYQSAMTKLSVFSPELAEWVETDGDVGKWALSRFGFMRWDSMTSNLAESFNAWILEERKHNVCTFIHEHRDKLAAKMVASKAELAN